MTPLPIDALLDTVVQALGASGAVVVEAPPGAGKTTRVPARILDTLTSERGSNALMSERGSKTGAVVVLEPRRLAARMSARRVAEERGERVGESVGYEVRFERAMSAGTRLSFVTEGIFVRKLTSDPTLRGVDVVVLDEFHERHLQGDLSLAMVQRLRATSRPDLKLVVMSATLDAAPIARFLRAPIVRSEGRAFPVDIEHLERADDRPLELQVASAVRRILHEGSAVGDTGDVLVFLPGALEIRRAQEACERFARALDVVVLPLHGELPTEAQDRAIARADRRKVILSTNIAETSLTIDGVAAVVDAGLARVAGFDAWSGRATLDVQKISRASATQRAGRAGRTRPGRALRLYTRGDHDTRRAHDTPEILRADLAETILQLHAVGEHDVAALPWLDPPTRASIDAGRALLDDLGALTPGEGDAAATLTDIGRRMSQLPLPPRIARVLVEADRLGVGEEGAGVAAILAEGRSLLRRDAAGNARNDDAPSDVLVELERLDEASPRGRLDADRARRAGLDVGAAISIDRARQQLHQHVGRDRAKPNEIERSLRIALMVGFSDHVAQRRIRGGEPGRLSTSRDLVFARGGGGSLAEWSVVKTAAFMVALDARDRDGRTLVTSASAIDPSWLFDRFIERIREEIDVRWDSERQRVEATERMSFGALPIDERLVPSNATGAARTAIASELHRRAKEAGGLPAFSSPSSSGKGEGDDAIAALAARISFVVRRAPDLATSHAIGALDDAALDAILRSACDGRRSFADLRNAGLLDHVREQIGYPQLQALDRLAPERIALGNGRRVAIDYAGEEPSIGSRLQDFFGSMETPRVLDGRVPLVVHLHAPNGRDVQVTRDLASFWRNAYPELRRALMRRYPRHAWPEDPRTAEPPEVRGRR